MKASNTVHRSLPAQAAVPDAKGKQFLDVQAPRFEELLVPIIGTAPLVVHKFSAKAIHQMKAKQEAGDVAKTSKKREAKDFEDVFQNARHLSTEGWDGVPASAFRNAMISACRTVGVVMSRAKLAIFIKADGVEEDDGVPLVRILGPAPERHVAPARNDNGSVDIRCRPMWRNWKMRLLVSYDADMIDKGGIINLLMRVGKQVGICEGRPDSRDGTGMGWGTFELDLDGVQQIVRKRQ